MHVSDDRIRARGAPAFPTNRAYLALGAGFLLFALYGSLLPFRLDPLPLEAAWHQFTAVLFRFPPRRISRSDLLANALLFIPVGFTLAGALLIDRSRRFGLIRATAAILPVSIAVSLLAEFLQTFTTSRVPSNTDVAAQTAGCLAGIAFWAVAGPALTQWLREAFAAAPEDRLSRVLTAFAAGWVFVNLVPFDISVDAGDLARRVRTGKISIVPFTGPELPVARLLWDALAEVLSAVPLGAFGLIAWRRGNTSRSMAFACGAAIVLAVEGAQIFISSHSASTTDLLFAWIGVALGVAIGARVSPRAHRAAGPQPTGSNEERISPIAIGIVACWCLVLCAYHWMPYDFGVDTDDVRRKLSRISLLPFAGYRSGSYLSALSNLLTKLALSAPLGLALTFAFGARARRSAAGLVISLGLAAVVVGAIELGQFFLPGRVPDPTDVLVGLAGAYAGIVLGGWLRSQH